MLVYDEQYIKAKVIKFHDEIKTNFLADEIPKESEHYICITCINIDPVMRMEKKNYSQVYLEESKYRMEKTKKFVNTELESQSESDIELELKSESEPDIE